jgi:hypothetical protein
VLHEKALTLYTERNFDKKQITTQLVYEFERHAATSIYGNIAATYGNDFITLLFDMNKSLRNSLITYVINQKFN